MENIFARRPILVEIQTLEGSVLHTRFTAVLTGELPANVADAIEARDAKKLAAHFGPDWKSMFGVSGGDEDLFDIEQPAAPASAAPTAAPRKGIKVVRDLHVYPEDRVSELKEKLAAALAIDEPKLKNFNTHWYARTSEGVALPLSYRISADGAVPIDIEAALAAPGGSRILGAPLDMHMYQNKGALTVHALDYFTNLGDLHGRGITRYKVVCIDEFFRGQEHLITDMISHDPYQLEMLYAAFVVKFFPLMSFDVFKLYYSGAVNEVYPDLMGPPGRFAKETAILDEKYRLLDDARAGYKKHPDLRKYQLEVSVDPSFVSKGQRVLRVVIQSIVLNARSAQAAQLNMRNLFEHLTVSAELPLTRLKLLASGRFFILSKLYSGERVSPATETELQRIYEIVRPYFGSQYYNTILIVLRILDKSLAAVTIFDNGSYQVRVLWDEEAELTFARVNEIIDAYVAPLARRINEMGRLVFENSTRLAVMNRNNVDFTGLNVALVWRVPIPESTFEQLKKKLREHMDSHIIRPVPEPDVGSVTRFYIMKGMTYDDPRRIEELVPLTNYYAYLTDAAVRQRWLSLYAQRLVLVTRYTTDVRFEIHNIKEPEFGFFYQYVVALLYWLEHSAALSSEDIQRTLQEKRKTGVLQTLKAYDPALYVLKRYGSDLVYSRLCQRAHQPVPYTEEEYEYLDPRAQKKAVRYWNFTTGRPMYYTCPDARYPKLHFIVDRHPMGYCIPCCMKRRKESSRTKKDRIFEICMREHKYTEQESEETSRYIMNYGKFLEPGRVSRVPDILERYIRHTRPLTKSATIDSAVFDVFNYKGVNYAVTDIIKRIAHTKVAMVPMKRLAYLLEDPAIKIVLERPESYPLQMAHIRASRPDPIILLAGPELKEFRLVDGLYRLARLYLEGAKEAPVRYVSTAQLVQLRAARAEPEGERGTKEPAYLLFGVSQVDDLGGVHAVAAALQLEVPQMAELCMGYIKAHPDVDFLRTLLNGQLLIHFRTVEDLLVEIRTRFILGDGPSVAISYFSQWNELFIDMCFWCFGKGVYIIEDTSAITVGTSVKGETITNIEIIYNQQVRNADEYIVLFRRRRRGQRLMGSSYLYYPVFIIIPRRFFSDGQVERRLYSAKDDLPQLLQELTRSRDTEIEEERISLATAVRFAGPRLKRLFVNLHSHCYAVLIDNVYFPVAHEVPNVDAPVSPALNKAEFSRLSDFQTWKATMERYNAFVCEEAEKLGRYRVIKQELPPGVKHQLNKREAGVLPVRPLVKVDRLILWEGQVIGAICAGWRYFFRPASARKVFNGLLSGYWIWRADPRPMRLTQIFWRDKYPPYAINEAIGKRAAGAPAKEPPHKRGLEAAFYRYGVFHRFVMDFVSHLDGERDKKLRATIRGLVARTNLQDMNAYNALVAQLRELVSENDLHVLTEQLHIKSFDSDFDNSVYEFDRITLNRLAKTRDPVEVRKIIDSVAAHIVSFKDSRGGRLFMKRALYNTVASELTSQFVNPTLRWFLLRAVIVGDTRGYFRFTPQPHTKIYVWLETPKMNLA